MRNRVRTIEYEGIHLVCFGCGTYGHRKEACPNKPATTPPEDEQRIEKDTLGIRREATLADFKEERALVGKEIMGKSGPSENFGPWMLAKKSEKGNYKERSSRN